MWTLQMKSEKSPKKLQNIQIGVFVAQICRIAQICKVAPPVLEWVADYMLHCPLIKINVYDVNETREGHSFPGFVCIWSTV